MIYLCSKRDNCINYQPGIAPCWDSSAHGISIWSSNRDNCKLNKVDYDL